MTPTPVLRTIRRRGSPPGPELVADLSRQSRDALSAIIGYAEMLADDLADVLTQEQLQDFRRMRAAGARVLGVIGKLEATVDSERRRATTDALTGTFNRRHFHEVADALWAEERPEPRAMSVAMLDLDHFKQINDTLGHRTGDEVLVALVARCSRVIRDADLFARYGGEEFAILLPDTPEETARAVCERVRAAVGDDPIATSAGPVPVTISIGFASGDTRAASLGWLIERADRGLYQAKRAGRNAVRAALKP